MRQSKFSATLCCFLLLCSAAVWAQPAAKRPVTISDLFEMKTLSDVQISPDGQRAAFVVSEADWDENTFRTNIYLVDSASKSVTRLTNGPKHDNHPRWSPDGKYIAFLSDRQAKPEKAGKRQIWVISTAGGEAWQLTRGTFTISSFAWAPDGKRVAAVATEGETQEEEKRKKDKDDAILVEHDMKMGRIYLVSMPGGDSQLLYSSDRHVSSIDFSPKGDEVVFADQPTPRVPDGFHSVVRVIGIESKQVRELAGGDLTNAAPKFSPDGRYIAFVGGSQSDWAASNHLYVVPSAGGAATNLTRDFDEEISAFGSSGFDWAADSQSLYFSASKGMNHYIFRVALDAKVTQIDDGAVFDGSISVARDRIAFVHESPAEPPDVYFAALSVPAPLKAAGTKKPALPVVWKFVPEKATKMNPQVAGLSLGKVENVSWKNKKDGLLVEGVLIAPPDYKPGQSYPLLLVIHGGPAGQFSNNFSLRRGVYPVQVFASQGYVVLMPNPRGSGGYGEKFRKANVRDWGGMDYLDIQDGVDDLVARGIADKEHMGVMGWSYGGYMTSWTITQTARFKAASVGAGVTNLFSFYGVTDIPPFIESYFGKKPWEDREIMAAHSAMYFLDRVSTPTLIQHGTEDRRVPIAQGEELYTALRARNVPVEMIKYPRSEHGLSEPKLVRDAATRNLDWFDRYVRGNVQAAAWHKPAQPIATGVTAR